MRPIRTLTGPLAAVLAATGLLAISLAGAMSLRRRPHPRTATS